jgi:hypothetical protein
MQHPQQQQQQQFSANNNFYANPGNTNAAALWQQYQQMVNMIRPQQGLGGFIQQPQAPAFPQMNQQYMAQGYANGNMPRSGGSQMAYGIQPNAQNGMAYPQGAPYQGYAMAQQRPQNFAQPSPAQQHYAQQNVSQAYPSANYPPQAQQQQPAFIAPSQPSVTHQGDTQSLTPAPKVHAYNLQMKEILQAAQQANSMQPEVPNADGQLPPVVISPVEHLPPAVKAAAGSIAIPIPPSKSSGGIKIIQQSSLAATAQVLYVQQCDLTGSRRLRVQLLLHL